MFYETAHTFVAPMIKAWWRPKVTGLENVPETGPVIIAANHLANVDSFLVPVVFNRKVRYIIKADFWHKSGLTARIKQRFFETVGSIPVERGTLKSAQGSLEKAREVLDEGEVFAIYPEGTQVSRGSKNTRERPSSPWGSWEPRSFSFPEKPSPARVARNSRCASAPPSTSATSIVPCLKTAGAARSRTE